ncbi:hypothetical protein RvY_12133 [Ramazzottius varieornatus]|uniref:Uncharacterized protein n=1 Tax=Ramazzottius varieornatus TaxID=947166 RepID=A0A1D1VS92_RAMVA|nr:hypothetical protein RvY_12133 [Ramazzottius varieornatus]
MFKARSRQRFICGVCGARDTKRDVSNLDNASEMPLSTPLMYLGVNVKLFTAAIIIIWHKRWTISGLAAEKFSQA